MAGVELGVDMIQAYALTRASRICFCCGMVHAILLHSSSDILILINYFS